MTKITLYYNPKCPNCVRQAKRTAQLDWLKRIELVAGESPLGEVPIGEIVVVDKRSKAIFTGIEATRKTCMQVPLFVFYGLLLYIPGIRMIAGGGKQQCEDDACATE